MAEASAGATPHQPDSSCFSPLPSPCVFIQWGTCQLSGGMGSASNAVAYCEPMLEGFISMKRRDKEITNALDYTAILGCKSKRLEIPR